MPVPLFEIVGGKLKPTDPRCLNFADVLRRYGHIVTHVDEGSPCPPPEPDEEIVVVADARIPLYYVRNGFIVCTGYVEDDPCDILLFRAIDRDDNGKTQIVAISEKEIAHSGAWKIVQSDAWVRVGRQHVLIRVFRNLEEARANIVKKSSEFFFFASTSHAEGWNGVLVHGNAMYADPVKPVHYKVEEILGVPRGWLEIEKVSRNVRDVLANVLNPFDPDVGEVRIVRAIFTRTGLYLVAERMDGRYGRWFFGREFTQEEAQYKIRL